MARQAESLITFDKLNFEKSLRAECLSIMVDVKTKLLQITLANAMRMDFNNIPTILATGRMTSNALRKRSLIQSIVARRFNWELNGRKMRIRLSAMGSDFKESYIGWYYEYGTGTKYEPPKAGISLPYPGTYNKFRALGDGSRLVTRSRYTGTWTDMGGNERLSYSPKGGKPLPDSFEVEAYHWVENGLNSVIPYAIERFKEVPNKVNQAKFLKGHKLIIRG